MYKCELSILLVYSHGTSDSEALVDLVTMYTRGYVTLVLDKLFVSGGELCGLPQRLRYGGRKGTTSTPMSHNRDCEDTTPDELTTKYVYVVVFQPITMRENKACEKRRHPH